MPARHRRFCLALAVLLQVARAGVAQSCPPVLAHRPFVPWRAGGHLSWPDFEAPRCPLRTTELAITVGACSATVIEVLPCTDARGQATFWVASYFVKDRSWVKDSLAPDNRQMLAHEQVHFDINELFARRIRQCIAEYRRAGRHVSGPECHREIAGLLNEKSTLNTSFDLEVYHDPTWFSLSKWQIFVGQQLAALVAYQADAVGPTP